MLVSDRKRFVFLHNPKAAGSSIRSALGKYDDRNNFYWNHEDNPRLSRVVDKAHITLDDFSVYPDAPLIDDYFAFGFVRNPYSRVYSAFLERKSQWGLTGEVDFNQFVRSELNEINIRFDWNFVHFCPQFHFFYRGGKCKADFIGHFETLQRDFPRALNLASLDADIDLPYLNRRSIDATDSKNNLEKSHHLEKYDAISLSVVNRLYDRDFVYFGYDKFGAEHANDPSVGSNAHVEEILAQTGFIKGEEAYYASRSQKLAEENSKLHEQLRDMQGLEDETRGCREEMLTLRGQLQASIEMSEALRDKIHKTSDALEASLQEVRKMQNSKSWKMTKLLRKKGNWSESLK